VRFLSAGDPPTQRAIQTALQSSLGERHEASAPSRVSRSLLLAVHVAQAVLAGLFCWSCLRVYVGAPDALPGSWLVLLALGWTAVLPLAASLWRFAIPLEQRLSWWALYWLGLLGPLLLVVAFVMGRSLLRLRSGEGQQGRPLLLLGVVTTWPLMQVAAHLACSRALEMKVIEDSALSPYWSVVCVYGMGLVLPLALVTVALGVRRARLVHARVAGELGGPSVLAPGEAVVRGTVELAEGENRALRLEVDQHGTESESSGTWSQTWTETRRRLEVRPFYLRTSGGARVRVLAGDDPRLMDSLDGKILVNRTERTCVAELTPREVVTAFGELVKARDPEAVPSGYRSASVGWVLQPPSGARMLLSSYPIDRPFIESARRILRHVFLVLALVGAGHAALVGYHLRVAFGQTEDVSVTSAWQIENKSDDGIEIEHQVTVVFPAGRSVTHGVTPESFVHAASERSIRVLRDPVLGSVQFGAHPTADFWAGILAAFAVLFTLLLGASDRPDAKWYTKAKLVDSESGRLPEAASSAPTSTSELRALVDEAFRTRSGTPQRGE
jgi:hypothetical protein